MTNKEDRKEIFIEIAIENFKAAASIIHSFIAALLRLSNHKNINECEQKEVIEGYLRFCEFYFKRAKECVDEFIPILSDSNDAVFIYNEEEITSTVAKALIKNEVRFWDYHNHPYIMELDDAFAGSSLEGFVNTIIPKLAIISEKDRELFDA